MLPNLCCLTHNALPVNVPRSQPPNYTLKGMDPPSSSNEEEDSLSNLCAICQEKLAGPAKADTELPDMLEIVLVSERQYHRYCIAEWVSKGNTIDPCTRQEISAPELQSLKEYYNEQIKSNNVHTAILENDVESVQEFIDEGRDVNGIGDDGMTPLTLSIFNSRIEIALLLIESDRVDVNKADYHQFTPLLAAMEVAAVAITDVSLVSKLLQRQDLVIDFERAISHPTFKSNYPIRMALLKDSRLDDQLERAFMAAVRNDAFRAVQHLLNEKDNSKLGLNSSILDDGKTPLMAALYNSADDNLSMILESPSLDPDVSDPVHKMTALMLACQKGKWFAAERILRKTDANVNLQNSLGLTALHIATSLNRIDSVQSLLLGRPNLNVNQQANLGQTALMIAARNGFTEIVKLLLGVEGVDLELKSSSETTAFDLAETSGHAEIAEMIRKAGIPHSIQ